MFKLIQTSIQDLMSIYYVWGPEVSKILLWKSEAKFLQAQLKAPKTLWAEEPRTQKSTKLSDPKQTWLLRY